MMRFPEFDPVALHLGPLAIHWYALMYIAAIGLGYFFVRRNFNVRGVEMDRNRYESLIFNIMLGVIVGGRLGYVLFYDPIYFATHPLRIILPFDPSNGWQFTGIRGMSFHGGALGVIIFGRFFCRKNGYRFYQIADPVMPLVAVGLGLGRLGNFINGELYGRITASRFGMLFPSADRLPLERADVQNVIRQLGWKVNEAAMIVTDSSGTRLKGLLGGSPFAIAINLPRHPSQLYEAILEGLVLSVVLFIILRRTSREGFVFWGFIGLYGIFRFGVEFLRQPDAHLGFLFLHLTMGQLLSSAMIITSIVAVILLWLRKSPSSS